ncbi:MAG: hypothetical protein JWM10_2196, partial [Myxococcaceae bacterium]|nr:hypothetical protein [Myxococcaceae bacterium]
MFAPRRRALALALGLSVALAAAGAPANGRFPTAQMVQLSTGAHPARMVLRTTFGVLVGEDDGRRWSWMCEDAFDYGVPDVWDPPVALGAPGTDGVPLLLGIPTGLRRTFDACGSSAVPEVGGDYTADLSATEDGRTVHWVGSYLDGASGGLINRVRRSDDGGRSFRTLYEGAAGVLFLTLEAAPSNPRRVYLTARAENPARDLLYRSDDGAMTLVASTLDLRGGVEGWVSGVDPNDPEVVYVRSFAQLQGSRDPGATLLLRSSDGGAHFAELTRTTGAMRGFALSGDGRTVWVGGPDDGLLRSVDGGAFERVSSVQVQCLRWHAGSLYVCGNHAVDGFNLARSDDGGRTMVPLVDFRTVGAPTGCPAGTAVREQCAPTWSRVSAGFGELPDAGAVMDAGRADAGAAMVGDGGGCAVGARGRG